MFSSRNNRTLYKEYTGWLQSLQLFSEDTVSFTKPTYLVFYAKPETKRDIIVFLELYSVVSHRRDTTIGDIVMA